MRCLSKAISRHLLSPMARIDFPCTGKCDTTYAMENILERWPVLGLQWAENSALRILAAIALFFALWAMLRIIIPLLLRRMAIVAQHTPIAVDDALISFLQKIPRGVLSLLSLLIAMSILQLPHTIQIIVHAGILSIGVYIGISLSQQMIEFALLTHMSQLRSREEASLPAILRITILLVLWGFGILLILSNLGINIVSLVTGLGIGGIAVALAVQSILSDMFSSFALYLDKPFHEGDFIIVGQHMGVVKKIGLKTTRIQALQGEEIVISNQELTSTRIQNFKRMDERRVQFRFGVTYDATPEQLRFVTMTVRDIIEGKKTARFDRAHFASFGDSSLDFEVVYYIQSREYNDYMDLQQEINLAIYEQLQAGGLLFAFPTRTVHLHHNQG